MLPIYSWNTMVRGACHVALLLVLVSTDHAYHVSCMQSFGVDLRQSSWLSILPFLMMAIGTNASGWIADKLINKKVMLMAGLKIS
jgi:MFS family permease